MGGILSAKIQQQQKLTPTPNGTLGVGVTSDLIKRVYEYYKIKLIEGFTKP